MIVLDQKIITSQNAKDFFYIYEQLNEFMTSHHKLLDVYRKSGRIK